MAASIRFTKAERELIEDAVKSVFIGVGSGHPTKTEEKLQQSILDKLEKSELVKKGARPGGIGWEAAAGAMREVLGPSLALPPRPDYVWVAKMNNRIRDLGLSLANCQSIAKVLLAKGWKVYSFEKTIWSADTLLASAQLDIPETRKRTETAPLTM